MIDSLRNGLEKLNAVKSLEFAPAVVNGKTSILDTTKITILNNLAWELMYQDADTAAILYKQALGLSQNLFQDSPPGSETGILRDRMLAKVYSNIGVLKKLNGDYDSSLYYHFKALELRKLLKDTKGLSTSCGNLGNTYKELGDYPKAMDYTLKALKIAEMLKDKNAIARHLGNIGVLYEKQSEYKKALDCYFKALEINRETDDDAGISRNFGNIGVLYSQMQDYEKAHDYLFRSVKLMDKLGNKNGQSRGYGNIGFVYQRQGDAAKHRSNFSASDSLYSKAEEYYYRALEITRQLGAKEAIALQLGNIGRLKKERKKFRQAEEFLQKALVQSVAIGSLHLIVDNNQDLSELYEEMGQHTKALEHYKKFIVLRDSLYNADNTKKLVQSEMNFEFEKKQAIAKAEQEKQNAINAQEKQKQKMILILVVCFLIIVVVFASFMYKRWRITQRQKRIIEKQKENIVDSISYAQLIQQSILSDETEIQKVLPDSFIYFQPKDIVSGDFYWFSKVVRSSESVVRRDEDTANSGLRTSDFQPKPDSELPTTNSELKNELLIIAAVDCTGHGVPGAFMSMIGNTLLNQIVNERKVTVPSEILKMLNTGISESLHQKKEGGLSRDGMDIALCVIDYKNNSLQYAGAHNPLVYISNNQIHTIKADKNGIGGHTPITKGESTSAKEFTNHTIPIKKGMSVYLFTDGYMDQFGGKERKKFGTQRFNELLANNHHLEMEKQKEVFIQELKNWRAGNPQVDDILVMGIRL